MASSLPTPQPHLSLQDSGSTAAELFTGIALAAKAQQGCRWYRADSRGTLISYLKPEALHASPEASSRQVLGQGVEMETPTVRHYGSDRHACLQMQTGNVD